MCIWIIDIGILVRFVYRMGDMGGAMKLNETYLLFTPDTDEAEARTRYRQRVGGEPREVKRDDQERLELGPVEDEA